MYYPKSQIQTGLFTNGDDYVIASTGQSYTGPYWRTSQGETFTGQGPSSPTPQRLAPTRPDIQKQITQEVGNADTFYTEQGAIYQKLEQIGPKLPIATIVLPTDADYTVGEYRRFFYKKNNELLYGEIDQNTYTQLSQRNRNIMWQLYYSFEIPWTLVGEREQVFRTNRNIVQLISEKNNLQRFGDFLKNDYLKYYKG